MAWPPGAGPVGGRQQEAWAVLARPAGGHGVGRRQAHGMGSLRPTWSLRVRRRR
ncbi:hypothetical protein ACUXAV_003782 [Cupriavidus metallidurans]|uniref:hypothetical protein n=1 Tax=Cupriavidus TaxID=106589 RepID=UPI001362A5D6|nr:hypothetical protein [Cupriavidus metallidurans]MDE4917484.1 hypothetical protein [Cupriavidus metallidurans]